MRRQVFFRADASPEIGLGHVRRCAVLAQACRLAGAEIHLLARWQEIPMSSAGDWEGAKIHEIPFESTPDEDAGLVTEICQQHELVTGVIDHYRLDEAYQQRLQDAGIQWMQFGNRNHTHDLLGRWVHDASPGAAASHYDHRRLGQGTEFFLGPSFALVSEVFSQVRESRGEPSACEVESVLVTFGGGDDRGATVRVLDWLVQSGFPGRRLVLTGTKNASLERLYALAALDQRIQLEVGNWNPAEAIATCQLAACAGGTTLHELACLGIPAVTVTIAENQEAPAMAWERAGFGLNLGRMVDANDSAACVKIADLIKDQQAREAMARCAWGEQDGKGADRVARLLTASASQPR